MQRKLKQIVGGILVICGLIGMLQQPFENSKGVQIAGLDVSPAIKMICKISHLPYDEFTIICIMAIVAGLMILLILTAAIKAIF